MTRVLGDLEFSFYHRWFDVIFLVCIVLYTSYISMLLHNTYIARSIYVHMLSVTGQCSNQHRLSLSGSPELS